MEIYADDYLVYQDIRWSTKSQTASGCCHRRITLGSGAQVSLSGLYVLRHRYVRGCNVDSCLSFPLLCAYQDEGSAQRPELYIVCPGLQ